MKRNISTKLLFVAGLVIIAGCKAKKLTTTQPAAAAPAASSSPVQANLPTQRLSQAPGPKRVNQLIGVKGAQLTFNTFSAKANAKLTIDGNTNDVSLTIRIAHNKEIWVSVAATILNVEVARAVITPDSINVINKVQGLYIKKPFSFIYQYANNQINYGMIEALLVGNAFPEMLNDGNASFQTGQPNSTVSGTLDDLVYSLILGLDLKTLQLNLSSHNQGQSLQVINNLPIPAGNQSVPSQVDIQSTSQNKKIQITLHYTRVELDQVLQYPFSIPERYTPAPEN